MGGVGISLKLSPFFSVISDHMYDRVNILINDISNSNSNTIRKEILSRIDKV